jgi:hypothetical protein
VNAVTGALGEAAVVTSELHEELCLQGDGEGALLGSRRTCPMAYEPTPCKQ